MRLDTEALQSLEQYVGFTRGDLESLREFSVLAKPRLGDVVEDFYAAIEQHPQAHKALTGGAEQVARLKETLNAWLIGVLTAERDQSYLDKNARIGRVHVRIELPQEYMFTAMNRIRCGLMQIAFDTVPAPQVHTLILALQRALDLELAIMLETYRQDMDARGRASARLATIGQLAATIGHELRNPLGVIDSSLFLMKKSAANDTVDRGAFDKHAARIESQTRLCTQIINNLLDLARDRPPRIRRHELRTTVDAAVALSGLPRTAVQLELADALTVDADPTDLAHVLSNLLLNAWQAQHDEPKVWLAAHEVSGGTSIKVSDAGPGIPEADWERVFDALYTTKAKGTGLGLALCRRVLESHRGDIRVVPSDAGATLEMFLPTHAASPTLAKE